MSLISSLAITSKIYQITFVNVEGSSKSEKRGRGCDMLTFRGFQWVGEPSTWRYLNWVMSK